MMLLIIHFFKYLIIDVLQAVKFDLHDYFDAVIDVVARIQCLRSKDNCWVKNTNIENRKTDSYVSS